MVRWRTAWCLIAELEGGVIPPVVVEPPAAEFLAAVQETCALLREQFPTARCLAYWGFGGTLLEGDCTEG